MDTPTGYRVIGYANWLPGNWLRQLVTGYLIRGHRLPRLLGERVPCRHVSLDGNVRAQDIVHQVGPRFHVREFLQLQQQNLPREEEGKKENLRQRILVITVNQHCYGSTITGDHSK